MVYGLARFGVSQANKSSREWCGRPLRTVSLEKTQRAFRGKALDGVAGSSGCQARFEGAFKMTMA